MASPALAPQNESGDERAAEITAVVGETVSALAPQAAPIVKAAEQLEPVAFHLGQLLAHLFSHYNRSRQVQKQ